MTQDPACGKNTGAPPSRELDPGEIRAALDGVLASETFSRSERSRELLQYVIERDLQGEADRLKGFAIALDVFDREDSFDPSTDAVVRVQAGRLRDLLDTYYAGEGKDDQIRISVPRGSYVPAYECRSCAAVPLGTEKADSAAAPDSPPDAQPVRHAGFFRRGVIMDMRVVLPAATAIVLLMFANIWLLVSTEIDRAAEVRALAQLEAAKSEPAAVEPIKPTPSAYLPSVTLMPGMERSLEEALEDAIPRFGSVIFRTDKSVTVDQPLSDFYIRAIPSGTNSVHLQLYDRERGTVIGTDQVPGGLDDKALADHVARITSRFLPVGGVIYAYLETEGRLNPLTSCLVQTTAYFQSQSAERHFEAYRCNEDLLEDGVNFALVYANLASLTVETKTDGYDYPLDTSLDDAIAYGRRAVELAPGSAQTFRSLAWAMQVSGELDAALAAIRQAAILNPYDLDIAASYGNTLIAKGAFSEATDVMERVSLAAPVHPTWWDFATFVAAFQTGRKDLVALSSRNLVGHDHRSHYCAARLIAADMTGDEALREKMLKTVAEEHSDFLPTARTFYGRMMPAAAADKLVAALYHAGLRDEPHDDG